MNTVCLGSGGRHCSKQRKLGAGSLVEENCFHSAPLSNEPDVGMYLGTLMTQLFDGGFNFKLLPAYSYGQSVLSNWQHGASSSICQTGHHSQSASCTDKTVQQCTTVQQTVVVSVYSPLAQASDTPATTGNNDA